jgi:prevent-host-death family protein
MPTVNMLEAKSNLSELVRAVEAGEQSEIIIARNGKPVARLVPIERQLATHRIGCAKGKFVSPDSIDDPEVQKVIEDMFYGVAPE